MAALMVDAIWNYGPSALKLWRSRFQFRKHPTPHCGFQLLPVGGRPCLEDGQPQTTQMRERLDDARERIHDLSAGFHEVASILQVDTSIEPNDCKDLTSGLTEADVEGYVQEARQQEREFTRFTTGSVTRPVQTGPEIAAKFCTGNGRTCPVSDCPATTAGGQQ